MESNRRQFFDKLASLMKGENALIGKYSIKSNALVALREPFGDSRLAEDIEPWLIETVQENLRGLQAEYSHRARVIDKNKKQLDEIKGWLLRAQEWSYPQLVSTLSVEITDLQKGIDAQSQIGNRATFENGPIWQVLGLITDLLKQDGVTRSAFWAMGVMLYSGVESAVLGIIEDDNLVAIYEEQGDHLRRIENRATQSRQRSMGYQDRIEEADLAELGKDQPEPPDEFLPSLKK